MNHPKSKLLQIAIPFYRMQTQLFDNVIAGIKTEDATKRLQDRTNHIVWMAGNIVNCRYWLAGLFDLQEKDPHDKFFADAKALDVNAAYPSLETLKREWHRISPVLYDCLMNLTDEALQKAYSLGMNVAFIEENKLNMVGMCLDRISYLTGQVSLMRRALGYDAMKYDINNAIEY